MAIALGDTFTKYHGKREKVAVLHIPGRNKVSLGLSDTHRCAKSLQSARATIENVAKGAVSEERFDEEAQLLHAHCRALIGIQEDPTTRRG